MATDYLPLVMPSFIVKLYITMTSLGLLTFPSVESSQVEFHAMQHLWSRCHRRTTRSFGVPFL